MGGGYYRQSNALKEMGGWILFSYPGERGKGTKMTEVLKVQGKGVFEGALECGLSGREGGRNMQV